jgi:hypothetical protein
MFDSKNNFPGATPNNEPNHEILLTSQLLKLSLLADGLFIDKDVSDVLVHPGEEQEPLTLADYATTSGVTLKLPGDIWVNVPLNLDDSASISGANRLTIEDGDLSVVSPYGSFNAEFIPVPQYHNQKLSDGITSITDVGVTHADRVRVSPIGGCAMHCNYCDTPYRQYEYKTRPITQLIEAINLALRDTRLLAQHILISGGTPHIADYGYENEVYAAIAQSFPHIDVDVMMVPLQGLLDVKELHTTGIHGLAINLELFNEDIAAAVMGHKAKASRNLYLNFIEKAVEEFGVGKVRSAMIVGLEPYEDTLRGVEALAERGCDPMLSPFRPHPLTPLANLSPPSMEDLLYVWLESQKIVEKYPGVKLGPRCIPCMHNCLAFPDGTQAYYYSGSKVASI